VEPAYERRRRASPILALDVHLAEPQEHLTRRPEHSALLQRRNSFVELASGNPTIRELFVELVVHLDALLLDAGLEHLRTAIRHFVEQEQIGEPAYLAVVGHEIRAVRKLHDRE